MKILLLDIETQPLNVKVWGLWDKFIPSDSILVPGYTMCFAAKWLGSKEIFFHRVVGRQGTVAFERSRRRMALAAHELIDEADAIIHYNGARFDIPTLNQEFLLQGLGPPSPHADIDLLRTAKQRFRLPSNKLSYVSKILGLEGKTPHKGQDLWDECREDDEKAWKVMEKYNKQDVKLLEPVYKALLPWIKNHPNYGLYTGADKPTCPNCGGTVLQRRGFSRTKTQTYQRFQCNDCGTWTRARTNETVNRANIMMSI